MKKFLLSLLLFTMTALPTSASKLLPTSIEKAVFLVTHETDHGTQGGTAFCVPLKPNVLVTADHVLGPELKVYDSKGVEQEVVVLSRDSKVDIATLLLKGDACKMNTLKWGPTGEVGEAAYVYGWGGLRDKPLMTGGIIASEPEVITKFPHLQAAQLNALGGHSGGPVFDSLGRVIGMLVGGFNALDEMDLIIPVQVLKKAVK